MRTAQGAFTLVELMVVLAIIAVLAVLATGWGDTIANNRRSSAINEFVAAINQARSEAISRGVAVTICRSTDPSAVAPTCNAAAAPGWESGWIIFTDTGVVGTVDGTDQILKAHSATPLLTITGQANPVNNRVSFNPGGTVIVPGAATSNGTIRFCDSRGFSNASGILARDVALAIGGRITTKTAPAGGTCP